MNKYFQRKIVAIFLYIDYNICFGAQNNRHIWVPTTNALVEK